MKGSYIPAVLIVAACAIISLDLWNWFKEEAKTEEIRAIKREVMHSIYIDSLRTQRMLDSLTRIGSQIRENEYRLAAYNRAVRIQNQQIRKQNENLIIELDSVRHLLDGRPEY